MCEETGCALAMNLQLLEPAIAPHISRTHRRDFSKRLRGYRYSIWREQDGLLSARILLVQMLRMSLLVSLVLPLWPCLAAQAVQSDAMRILQESWTVQDGAPEDTNSLAQTTDGFLWLGSSTGLFRFDGTRFERFPPLPGDHLLSSTGNAISR